jgi:hypothetical protein
MNMQKVINAVGAIALTVFVFPFVPFLLAEVIGEWGAWVGFAGAVVGIAAMIKPRQLFLLDARWKAGLLVVGLMLGSSASMIAEKKADLIALKKTNPQAYLDHIKKSDGDQAWLKALAEIDPKAHAKELKAATLREAKKLEAKTKAEASWKADLEKINKEARKTEVVEFTARIKRELKGFKSYRVDTYLSSRNSLKIGLALFSAWAQIIEDGEALGLQGKSAALLEDFARAASRTQANALPKMRRAFAKLSTRETLWERDMSARSFGNRFGVIEFVGAAFAANRNIKAFNQEIWETLEILRFAKVQYKWFKQADEYTYWPIKSLKDTQLIIWEDGGGYRKVTYKTRKTRPSSKAGPKTKQREKKRAHPIAQGDWKNQVGEALDQKPKQ